MLAFYSRVAGWLKRARFVLWIMLGGSIIAFGWIVFNPVNPEKSPVFLSAIFLFGWAICLLVIQAYFSQPIERPAPTDSASMRFKKRLVIALSWGVALAVTGLAVKMIMLMVQVFNLLKSNAGGA
ncbi:hypothetical protein C2W62_40155 [Candidatus Entotheonella serta]|nr:hypothetical protein C2W62_40155 [Candidatus Entotheonella serta]